MNIFELLDCGVIVAHDEDASIIVVWNTDRTFRFFHVNDGAFHEYDIVTVYKRPSSVQVAMNKGEKLLREHINDNC